MALYYFRSYFSSKWRRYRPHLYQQWAASGAFNLVYLTASLRLKTNDQVSLFNAAGIIHNTGSQYTHFTGWLEEEELK